jgi:hypothetical protein
MQPHPHGGDDAEVTAAAAQRPQQVRLAGLGSRHDRAVGEDDLRAEQVIRRQPDLTGENGWSLAEAEKWLLAQASSALLA